MVLNRKKHFLILIFLSSTFHHFVLEAPGMAVRAFCGFKRKALRSRMGAVHPLGPSLGCSHAERWHNALQRMCRIQAAVNLSLEREERLLVLRIQEEKIAP